VKTFSGGMKRRLEIGRGLIHKPKVLFLDEPTTGLDPQTRNNIWNHIKELNKEGMTKLVIYNTLGQIILETQDLKFSIENLASSTYFMKIFTSKGLTTRNFIKN
jgi:ABC-type multidrug transport system ATPase subunit